MVLVAASFCILLPMFNMCICVCCCRYFLQSALEGMQRYDPHRMAGLDLLSTTLWHLKRDVSQSRVWHHMMCSHVGCVYAWLLRVVRGKW